MAQTDLHRDLMVNLIQILEYQRLLDVDVTVREATKARCVTPLGEATVST